VCVVACVWLRVCGCVCVSENLMFPMCTRPACTQTKSHLICTFIYMHVPRQFAASILPQNLASNAPFTGGGNGGVGGGFQGTENRRGEI